MADYDSPNDESNPAVNDQPITLVAQVLRSGSGNIPATGPVSFYNGDTLLGVARLDDMQQASLPIDLAAAIDDYLLTADYGGDVNNASSVSTVVTETVDIGSAMLTVTADSPVTVVGHPVRLTISASAVAPAVGEVDHRRA